MEESNVELDRGEGIIPIMASSSISSSSTLASQQSYNYDLKSPRLGGSPNLPMLRETGKGVFDRPGGECASVRYAVMGRGSGRPCTKKLKAWPVHSLRGYYPSGIVSKHSDEALLPDGGRHMPTPPDSLSQRTFFIIHFPELPLTYLAGGEYL